MFPSHPLNNRGTTTALSLLGLFLVPFVVSLAIGYLDGNLRQGLINGVGVGIAFVAVYWIGSHVR